MLKKKAVPTTAQNMKIIQNLKMTQKMKMSTSMDLSLNLSLETELEPEPRPDTNEVHNILDRTGNMSPKTTITQEN